MTTTAKLRIALIVVVTLGVFYTSFRHIVAVAMAHGNTADVALFYPVSIDAVIMISALTLVVRNGVPKAARFWARFGRVFGFVATIYANVAHSGYASTDAVLVNLIPAVALICTVELLIHSARGTSASRRQATAKPAKPATRKSPARKLRAV